MAGQGQVHFKFKSTKAFDSVSFDGHYVSVGELKALIAERKVGCRSVKAVPLFACIR